MSPASALVKLYPAAFRDRWGTALEMEARAAGWKAWPNLLAGVADMWLHPTIWPARSSDQRRGRAATTATAITFAVWLLCHAVAEQNIPLPARPGRTSTLDDCAILMLLGVLLVAPRPRLSRTTTWTLLRQAARRLTIPAVLAAAVVAALHLAPHTVVLAPWRPLAFSCWWLALALGAAQACRTLATLDSTIAVPAHGTRLRCGMWILAAAAASAGSAIVGFSVTGGHVDRASILIGTCLLLLASAFVVTLRDLREVCAND